MSRQDELKTIPLLAGFDDQELAAFVGAAQRRSLPADQVVFAMGQRNASLFIIRAGSVKISRFGSAGDMPIATLGAGETFGEMSFMDGSPTTATVTTAEATEVLEISRQSVDELLDGNPELGVKLWRNLALDLKERLTRTDEVIDQYIDISQVLLQDRKLREYYSRL
jgi:CRP/FNR family cyclic AMP-dependent transcriptional regulator